MQEKFIADRSTQQKDAELARLLRAAEHEVTRLDRNDLFAMSLHYSPAPD